MMMEGFDISRHAIKKRLLLMRLPARDTARKRHFQISPGAQAMKWAIFWKCHFFNMPASDLAPKTANTRCRRFE